MIDKPLDLSQAVRYHTGAFPPKALDYETLIGPLEDAAASLARYDAKMAGMLNPRLLLAPLRQQDAVASSRMEGTISTIEELYRLQAREPFENAAPHAETRNDTIETFLYTRALDNAQHALSSGVPFGDYLFRAAHQTLLSSGRGARKQPGEYKTQQNYIGDDRSRTVHYIPIPPEQLSPAMQALTAFITQSPMRPLIRTAIAHVEFEALHPFSDGNGRVGRMLITLLLWKLGVLSEPSFFVSGYFEAHKAEYIARMRAVSSEGDWTGWVVFFLRAMDEQARVNSATADQIQTLYTEMRERFRDTLNSQYHDQALDFVFSSPFFDNTRFVRDAGIPEPTARVLSRRLAEAGLITIREPAAGRRPALYAFDDLLTLLKI